MEEQRLSRLASIPPPFSLAFNPRDDRHILPTKDMMQSESLMCCQTLLFRIIYLIWSDHGSFSFINNVLSYLA